MTGWLFVVWTLETVLLIVRVRNITEWRDKLDQCLRDLNLEISVQKDAKEACERALEAKNLPLEIALENLNVREGRQEFDVVKDEVEAQLQTEVQLIENIKDRLKQRCEESWDCLAKLEEIREIVELDLKDKSEALDIDMTQLDLSENSAAISHKPDATRIPKGSVQPETWYTYSENNKMLAEQAMAESQRLREAIFHSIEQTSNDLRVQQDATNFDFRKRHYEMKRAKEELEYQMKAVCPSSICKDFYNLKTVYLDSRRDHRPGAQYWRHGGGHQGQGEPPQAGGDQTGEQDLAAPHGALQRRPSGGAHT